MSNDCNDELKQLREKYSKLKSEYEILLKESKNHAGKLTGILKQLHHLAVQGYNDSSLFGSNNKKTPSCSTGV